MARASSGSRSSINSIEPLISANNAVTVLRSPSAMAVPLVCPAFTRMSDAIEEDVSDSAVTFSARSIVPQSPQKRLPGGFSPPHFGQRLVNGAPQSPQNFLSAGLSLPHFEQRIGSPIGHAIQTSFIILY